MTALWFGHLSGDDKVAVKPHASPVFHAIKYLTRRARPQLPHAAARSSVACRPTRSRTKDPDVVRLLDRLGGPRRRRAPVRRRHPSVRRRPLRRPDPDARFIALVGDAELDEGNVWEAIADPALQGLGNVTLDRRPQPPEPRPGHPGHEGPPAACSSSRTSGWHVVEAKYGRRLQEAFARPGGEARCAGTSTTCRTRSTRASSPSRAPSSAQRFLAHADADGEGPARRGLRRRAGARSSRTSAATTSAS